MHFDPEHVQAYFIKGDPEMELENEIVGDTIYSRVTDCYKPGILEKTLCSMEFMLEEIKRCDYVLRTNLSSFYYFPRLLKFLNTLPKTNCYCAHQWVPFYKDVTKEFLNIPFGWGAGFILSPDLVEMLVQEKDDLLTQSASIADDVLIGNFFHKREINIIPADFYKFTNYAEWKRKKEALPPNIFHFRAKKLYSPRELADDYGDECLILSELVEKFYPSTY